MGDQFFQFLSETTLGGGQFPHTKDMLCFGQLTIKSILSHRSLKNNRDTMS
jgi:hypothetical protein